MHALVTGIICSSYLLLTERDTDDPQVTIVKSVGIYGGIISVSLFWFAGYQMCYLGVKNIATNEEIRVRWNAHGRNQKYVEIYKNESSNYEKFKHHVFGELPESRLHKQA